MVDRSLVSREEWLQARRELLAEEKAFTKARDALAEKRRALPWVRIEKDYVFTSSNGPVTLAELFSGRSQLVVYHFMYGPDWEQGCPSCSFWADNFDGIDVHLAHRDTSFVTISNTAIENIEAYKQRMGWQFRWLSSLDSDFNRDFHVTFTPEEVESGNAEYNFTNSGFPITEAPGLSVFVRLADRGIAHSYSCYARGLETVNGAYHMLDLTPQGRGETGLPFPMAWVRRHDQYED